MIIIQFIVWISISYINSAASLLYQQQQLGNPSIQTPLIKFHVMIYEDKLTRLLIPAKILRNFRRYSNFLECTNAIADILTFDTQEINPLGVDIRILIDSVKIYSKFILKFAEVKEKCIMSRINNDPSTDVIKLSMDLLFNKDMISKLVEADRNFQELLDKFSFIIDKNSESYFFEKSSFEFIGNYVELLYSELFQPFMLINTSKDFIDFMNNQRIVFQRIIETTISSFEIIIFKHAVNIFLLVFKEVKEAGVKNIVVNDKLKDNGLFEANANYIKQLEKAVQLIQTGLGSLRVAKIVAEAIGNSRWKIEYVIQSNLALGSLLKTWFEAMNKI